MASISFPRLRGMSGAHKLIAVGAFAALAAAAGCSSGTSGSSTSTAASSGSGGSGGSATVIVASKGTVGAVLSNGQGMTLYRYTPDKPGVSNCTGGCATTWPPLVLPSGVTSPVAGTGVTGLGTIMRSDGSHQVTYNGMPLYTFTGDSSRTDAAGQGLDGTWFVIKPGAASTATTTAPSGGAAPTATTKAPTPTTAAPSGGGYGY